MQISIWEKESFFQQQDVIIIGSGLVGLWSAILLKEKNPSLKVAIVEQGSIPSGASSRNAGFACFGNVLLRLSEWRFCVRHCGRGSRHNVGKKTGNLVFPANAC